MQSSRAGLVQMINWTNGRGERAKTVPKKQGGKNQKLLPKRRVLSCIILIKVEPIQRTHYKEKVNGLFFLLTPTQELQLEEI